MVLAGGKVNNIGSRYNYINYIIYMSSMKILNCSYNALVNDNGRDTS
jgi:hypothetical protein